MKIKITNLFRPLLFVALSVAVFACKKKNDDTPAPANIITAGNASHKISHAYHEASETGRYHALVFTSEGLEIKDGDYTGSGKLMLVYIDTEKDAATTADAVLLPEGVYTSEKIEGTVYADILNDQVVSANTVELTDSEINVTKSGETYTIRIKSRDGNKNEAYEIYYKGKLEEASIAL
jgi:hypothetical protein